MNSTTAMLLAAGAGICIALQAGANSALRESTREPLWATYFSIIGTILFSSTALLILRPSLPTLDSVRSTAWWQWIGGPLGAMIVMSGTFLVPHLGAARFIAFVVAGQLLASVLLDHFALMGLPEQTLTPAKLGGAVLILLGVIVMKYL